MTNKEIVKSILPNARQESHKERGFQGKKYYLIRNGRSFAPLAEGYTAAEAWKNTIPIVLEIAKVAIEKEKLKTPKNGIKIISEERKRQVEKEGYTVEHDDQHTNNELAIAAGTYAINPLINEVMLDENEIPHLWPWSGGSWKPVPENRIKELAKAGALLAAEIDRLLRISSDT